MGRVTYEAMAGYWPASTHAYAAPMNEIPKIVFSNTLDRADWGDTQIIRGDLAAQLARPTGDQGKPLPAPGRGRFPQPPARHHAIDEHRHLTPPRPVGAALPM